MPNYMYSARDRNGLMLTGQLDAVDEDELVAILQNRGLIVTSLRSQQALSASAKRRLSHGRVSGDDKVLFCQQLAALLGAGIPLLKSLEVVGAQVESRQLLYAIQQMHDDIEGGKSFRDAMGRHPNIFTLFWLNMVETGEASGHLSQSLTQLAQYLESVRTLQQKAITALTYPAVLVFAAVVAVMIFVLAIVPRFTTVFASMHAQLPLLTRVIIGTSNFCRQYIFLIVAVAIGLGYIGVKFFRTDQGRWILDRVVLKLPVLDQLFANLQLAQFSRGFSALLESGVPILFSLEIMQSSATNKVYGDAIGLVKEAIKNGKSMAEPMLTLSVFPPMIVQMVQVGEEIGELAKMLDRVAKYYEQRVEFFLDRMATLFEPVAIVIMALVIGILVIGMFLPIFSLATAVRA